MFSATKGEDGEVARPLDGDGEFPLVDGRRAGDFAGHDLAPLVHELPQQLVVLVIDKLDLGLGEVSRSSSV